jgi:hypothetical protein
VLAVSELGYQSWVSNPAYGYSRLPTRQTKGPVRAAVSAWTRRHRRPPQDLQAECPRFESGQLHKECRSEAINCCL